MKTFLLAALLIVTPVMILHGKGPEPVTNLGGGDNVEKLIEGYPKEAYDITSTLCGLKPTPEFRQGYMMAMRLCFLGAAPHYLVYDELEPLTNPDPSLEVYHLTNYKRTARLLEAIRGFNYSMTMIAWEAKAKKQIQHTEEAGAGQPATRSDSKPEGNQKPQPESEGRSR